MKLRWQLQANNLTSLDRVSSMTRTVGQVAQRWADADKQVAKSIIATGAWSFPAYIFQWSVEPYGVCRPHRIASCLGGEPWEGT